MVNFFWRTFCWAKFLLIDGYIRKKKIFVAPLSSIFFLNSIHLKKMLYLTIYAVVGGIRAVDWVEGSGKKVSDAEGKGKDLKKEREDGFRCLAHFCIGVNFVVIGKNPIAFAVGFFIRFESILNIYSTGNTSETRKIS